MKALGGISGVDGHAKKIAVRSGLTLLCTKDLVNFPKQLDRNTLCCKKMILPGISHS